MARKTVTIEDLEKVVGGLDMDEQLINNLIASIKKDIRNYEPELKNEVLARIYDLIEANKDYDAIYISNLARNEIGRIVCEYKERKFNK